MIDRDKIHPWVSPWQIDKVERQYPFRCLCAILMGPDPEALHDTMTYGHFARLPRTDGYNLWCFETPEARDRFKNDHHHTEDAT